MLAGECKRDAHEQGASSSLRLTLELGELLPTSAITWTMPYRKPWTGQQIAAWLVDRSSRVNGQHPIWKAVTLVEEVKNRSALCVELHIVFLAVMEMLNSG